ncbi:uncharacterized protein DUF4123 [Litoreibacter ponti]|uniref:Uncharacterized protein DUF4123 n=1 Tax=Litoreibacter ponti TaxID=1510457 RepID=A0A2T6BLT1_9RHOB|nr:DUF4123 domain-containing protein [Litoreibacter ponti]PTX57021.1 uncharacterized protein DUF4123 [Litoreibacter ponti]
MTQTVIMDLATPSQAQETLSVEYVGPVEPLDAQFGTIEKLCVPETLAEVAFQPNLTTYAVVDNAAIPGITGMAEGDGLEKACLFKGELGDELGEVAPWIIALKPDSKVTRAIFTKGDAQWHLWRKPTVLLVQSDAPLDKMRAHFRKFTRAQDENGAWLFFRFWELPVLRALRKSGLRDTVYAKLLGPHRFLYPDLGPDGDEGLWVLHAQEDG